MTDCRVIENKIPEFHEDLIQESERRKIRDHLEVCTECRAYAARQTHTVNDFKRLNETFVPFDFAKIVLQNLSTPEVKITRPPNIPLTFALGFITGMSVMLVLIFLRAIPELSQTGNQRPTLSESEAYYYYRQLEEIHDRLEKPSRSLPAPSEESKTLPAPLPAPAPFVPAVQSIAPVTWEMVFPHASTRSAFLKELDKKKWNRLLNRPQIIILKLSSSELKEFRTWSEAWNRFLENSELPLPPVIPDFQEPVNVALILKASIAGPEDAGVRLMSAKFYLQNSTSLSERLSQLGFGMLYQSGSLWVFEFPASEFPAFESAVKTTNAVTLKENRFAAPDYPAEIIRVIFKIE